MTLTVYVNVAPGQEPAPIAYTEYTVITVGVITGVEHTVQDIPVPGDHI